MKLDTISEELEAYKVTSLVERLHEASHQAHMVLSRSYDQMTFVVTETVNQRRRKASQYRHQSSSVLISPAVANRIHFVPARASPTKCRLGNVNLSSDAPMPALPTLTPLIVNTLPLVGPSVSAARHAPFQRAKLSCVGNMN